MTSNMVSDESLIMHACLSAIADALLRHDPVRDYRDIQPASFCWLAGNAANRDNCIKGLAHCMTQWRLVPY